MTRTVSETNGFRLALFDLEGTLVDFQWQLGPAAEEILEFVSRSGIDPDRYGPSPDYATLFNLTKKFIRNWNAELKADLLNRLARIYDRYDRDALDRWTPYPDTLDLLRDLNREKIRMGVVSNCGTAAVQAVLDRFAMTDFFDLILARNHVDQVKPSPEGLVLALEKLGVRPDQAIFVGDSINDIQAADKVPMPSCFLSRGESRVTGKTANSATFTISFLSELYPILIQSPGSEPCAREA